MATFENIMAYIFTSILFGLIWLSDKYDSISAAVGSAYWTVRNAVVKTRIPNQNGEYTANGTSGNRNFQNQTPTISASVQRQIDISSVIYRFKPGKKASSTPNRAITTEGVDEIEEPNSFGIIDPSETCTFCYEDFVLNIELRRLPCLHVFHRLCIDKWLQNRITCPICCVSVQIDNRKLLANLESGETIEECLFKHLAGPRSSATVTSAMLPVPIAINQQGTNSAQA